MFSNINVLCSNTFLEQQAYRAETQHTRYQFSIVSKFGVLRCMELHQVVSKDMVHPQLLGKEQIEYVPHSVGYGGCVYR